MNARKAQKLRDMLLLKGFVMMLGACIYEPLIYAGMVVAFSCLIPDYLYNKCPHCGKRLGRNEAEYCQFCGGKICEE